MAGPDSSFLPSFWFGLLVTVDLIERRYQYVTWTCAVSRSDDLPFFQQLDQSFRSCITNT
jgi:hypothetical protein